MSNAKPTPNEGDALIAVFVGPQLEAPGHGVELAACVFESDVLV